MWLHETIRWEMQKDDRIEQQFVQFIEMERLQTFLKLPFTSLHIFFCDNVDAKALENRLNLIRLLLWYSMRVNASTIAPNDAENLPIFKFSV